MSTNANTSARRGRLEDRRLITGAGRYADDWSLPNQAHACFVRSDRAHARIVSLDTSAARDAEGVIAVLTGTDALAAGFGPLPHLMPVKGRDGMTLLAPPRPVLAGDTVRFVGEPIAMVVAETRRAALDAAERAVVEYQDLPAVVSAVDALTPNAPQLHADVPGNLAFDIEAGNAAAADAAFAQAQQQMQAQRDAAGTHAHRIVHLKVRIPRVVANPMEPRACLGVYDADTKSYVLHACIQGAFHMRQQLSRTLNVPIETIRVTAEDVGGSFGVRSNVYPEDCAVLLAAMHTGRPVKWLASRSEVFLSDEQGRDVVVEGELALDAQGRMQGVRFAFTSNLGAYPTMIGPLANTLGTTTCLTGVYDLPAAYARTRLAYSNTVPTASYRGAGRPLMSYALERLIDQAAHEMQIDAGELRRSNLIRNDAFPYQLANGTVYDCGDFANTLAQVQSEAAWSDFAARRAEAASRGQLRGIGLAMFIESTSPGFMPADHVQIRFEGGNVLLHAPSHSNGQGHETSFAQIFGGVLGIAPERIRLATSSSNAPFLEGNLTSGARSLASLGSVLLKAAEEVVNRGKPLVGAVLGKSVESITFDNGVYRVSEAADADTTTGTTTASHTSATQMSMADLIAHHAIATPHPLSLEFHAKFGATFPNGAHIAEVEIDPVSGALTLVNYTACDDSGNIINHQIVEGQMHGGIAQGLGEAFHEEAVFDAATGQLLSGSLLDYTLPRAGWARALTLLAAPVPTNNNPLGAKGAGEAGVTGALPALMNAVLDALRQAGVEHFDMPATSARIWMALQRQTTP